MDDQWKKKLVTFFETSWAGVQARPFGNARVVCLQVTKASSLTFLPAVKTAPRLLLTERQNAMILLDTNILSELMRPAPDPALGRWMLGLGDTPVATTAVTVSEIAYGLERLADGRRKDDLVARFDQLIFAAGPLTVLPFDEVSALVCGRYRALREREGLHAPPSDMMIAGIAGALGADLATRNTKDFSGLPIMVINPWMA